MTSPYAHGPAPTATLIKTGRNSMRNGLIGGAGCGVIGLAFVVAGIVVLVADKPGTNGVGALAFGALLLMGPVIVLLMLWKGRNAFICVDHVGLWISNPRGQKVIPWDSLAGVGLHWSKPKGKGPKQYSLELCPGGPIDRDHPVLWNLVRDEEPLHPSLPRLRYRLPANGKDREPLVTAVQQYAAHLWLGEVEREPNHIGFPDVKGHRARTRGRG
ncbi:hypothetical protein P8605_03235 [Streptomyces sp. T-3]|nr:hypothetical protein [Streptomyces sp. T-3]